MRERARAKSKRERYRERARQGEVKGDRYHHANEIITKYTSYAKSLEKRYVTSCFVIIRVPWQHICFLRIETWHSNTEGLPSAAPLLVSMEVSIYSKGSAMCMRPWAMCKSLRLIPTKVAMLRVRIERASAKKGQLFFFCVLRGDFRFLKMQRSRLPGDMAERAQRARGHPTHQS
jgi:hypothetical protein